MAQPKKMLFIGRTDPDTGYDDCVQLAKLLNFHLTVITDEPDPTKFISQTDYVFASGYLSILESALAGKLIFASYSDPIRKDYLLMHPIASHMIIGQTASNLAKALSSHSNPETAKMIELAHTWAVRQTWPALVKTYETLWKI